MINLLQNFRYATLANAGSLAQRGLVDHNGSGSGSGSVEHLGPRLFAWRDGLLAHQPQRGSGYIYDHNLNGRYNAGNDSVLLYDMNGNGKLGRRDVHRTNNMMKAAVNNFDFNGDGLVSLGETRRGARLRDRFASYDANNDGRLGLDEVNRSGGRLWVDYNRDGRVQRRETNNIVSINNPNSAPTGHPPAPQQQPVSVQQPVPTPTYRPEERGDGHLDEMREERAWDDHFGGNDPRH